MTGPKPPGGPPPGDDDKPDKPNASGPPPRTFGQTAPLRRLEELLGTRIGVTFPPALPAPQPPAAPEPAARPAPPAPQETETVRLRPRPDPPPAWRVIFRTAEPATTTIGLNVLQVLIIGRSDPTGTEPDLDLAPHGSAAQGVSRQHAMLIPANESLAILDMDSTNGTWVNGQYLRAGERRVLRAGDRVELGLLVLEVQSVSRIQRKGR